MTNIQDLFVTELDSYEMKEKIGQGAFGIVRHARSMTYNTGK